MEIREQRGFAARDSQSHALLLGQLHSHKLHESCAHHSVPQLASSPCRLIFQLPSNSPFFSAQRTMEAVAVAVATRPES